MLEDNGLISWLANGTGLQAKSIEASFKGEQEMPSWQQKSAKKGSKRYLVFGPNNILVTLKWGDRRCPGHENVCRWFLNRYR